MTAPICLTRIIALWFAAVACCLFALSVASVHADPCGMVPPIYTGPGSPIKRIGLQQTYVYFDSGVETFVIRPGFQGKVDNFGMLIPFPSPPEIRKVPDNIFEHIAAAVDPPEVVVDLRMRWLQQNQNSAGAPASGMLFKSAAQKNEVRVLKKEAVGMYEVAVLEAGSSAALKRWMDQHKYVYPDGMDKVCDDYISERWCFVAVKTKVGQKDGVDPVPGQRNVMPDLPQNSVFDGNVQGLGFRFPSTELVVPMRLSAFNEGELRNVVYLMSSGGKRIRSIPEEYVVRQISGQQLIKNLTGPRPLRIIGGTEKDIPDWRRKTLATERLAGPVNGMAKQLFTSDIVATQSYRESGGGLSLQFEETEKELLRIGEHFGLRGKANDDEIAATTAKAASREIDQVVKQLERFTLTVVDGDFPRQVLANQNLKFAPFQMAAERNSARFYDAKLNGPAPKLSGKLISAADPWKDLPAYRSNRNSGAVPVFAGLGLFGLAILVFATFSRVAVNQENE